MAEKQHENIDCSFFDLIVNGRLRPFLPVFDSDDELRKLNSITIDTLSDEEFILWCTDEILPQEIKEKFNFAEGDVAEFYKTDENEFLIQLSKPDTFLEPLIDIDIPPTFDYKTEAFLTFIENEFETMQSKAQKALESAISEKQLALYANKNIQSLKHIAPLANRLYKQLNTDNKDYLNDSNVYVIYLVKVFVIRAISFYQELFYPFTKTPPEDYYELKTALFGDPPLQDFSKIFGNLKVLEYKNITDIFDYINGGILQLELFIKGSITKLIIYNISGAFSKLFQEIIKVENFNSTNLALIDKYYAILNEIINNDDKGGYKESVDVENKFFKRMLKQIYTSSELIEDFAVKYDLGDDEPTHSIFDILLNKEPETQHPEKSPSNFIHTSIEKFLQTADPYEKYKSDWSCQGFYGSLKSRLTELEPEFQLLFTSVPLTDRHIFIDSYLKHIKNVTGNYVAGTEDNARFFLEENKFSLEDVFDNQINIRGISLNEFPGYFKHSFETLYNKGFDYKITDLHSAFIFLISDHFVIKLQNFIQSLSAQNSPPQPPENNPQPSQTTLPNPAPDKNTIPNAYTYTKYSSNLSALSDTLDCLKKNNFVAQDTELKEFRKIFNNKTPSKPIPWTGTISELAYFVKYLHNELKLILEIKSNIWKVTSKLFVDVNGEPFDNQRFRGQKTPAKADLLEKAAEHLQ